MSNNSAIAISTVDGQLVAGEIGRAQAMQAAACGLEPDIRFNPVLLKPGANLTSQVIVRGQVVGSVGAGDFDVMRAAVAESARQALSELRADYDVVICEGAGSPAEINLRRHDFVNLGLARSAQLPVIVVGDIDRGGVFAALVGTLAVLEPADQALVAGFVINRFRGDRELLRPGVEQLTALTGRPTYGVLPFSLDLWLDGEDALAYGTVLGRPGPPRGDEWLRVAVVRLPHISNATDAEALAAEPGVRVRLTIEPAELDDADLVVLPGTKSTVDDLAWLRATGLADAIGRHAGAGWPLLGICGGFQMLAEQIHDEVESGRGTVPGLGLAPVEISFQRTKTVGRAAGHAGGVPVRGYEIHHGSVSRYTVDAEPLLRHDDGRPDGIRLGNVFGTHWHGAFESDDFRRAVLTETAALAGRHGFRVAPDTRFGAARERMLNALGDLIEQHVDTDALWRLIEDGAPAEVPTLGLTLG
jgi:adenosylcobyric acid synthase